MKELPEVLFGCVHNAGRLQMAAALVHVLLVGMTSADQINLAVVAG